MRTQQNYNIEEIKGELFEEVSMTIPEQTLSLQTLIQRYTRGQEVVKYKGQYANLEHDDLDLSKFNRYDPVDRLKISKAYAEKIKELDDKLRAKIKVDERNEVIEPKPGEKHQIPNETITKV